MDVQNMSLLQLDLRTSDKAVFVEQQVAQCTRASAQFEESMQHIITEVQQVITDITSHHSASLENRTDGSGLAPNGAASGNAGGNTAAELAQNFTDDLMPEKVKSLVKIKQEKLERKQTRHFAKIEYRSIPDFIRFVDYLTVETLVSLAVNSAMTFYQEFIKTRKSGIFETHVRFSSTGTTFSPTCADIRDALDGLLDTMINTVGNVNRVSYLSSVHNLKGGGNNPAATLGGANIQHMIRESRQFRKTAENIHQRIIADFERAEDHAQSFESIRPIYDFNATWNFEEYRSQQHDITELKSILIYISNWNKELEKLRNRPIGVLEVDSKRLKNELVPLREVYM